MTTASHATHFGTSLNSCANLIGMQTKTTTSWESLRWSLFPALVGFVYPLGLAYLGMMAGEGHLLAMAWGAFVGCQAMLGAWIAAGPGPLASRVLRVAVWTGGLIFWWIGPPVLGWADYLDMRGLTSQLLGLFLFTVLLTQVCCTVFAVAMRRARLLRIAGRSTAEDPLQGFSIGWLMTATAAIAVVCALLARDMTQWEVVRRIAIAAALPGRTVVRSVGVYLVTGFSPVLVLLGLLSIRRGVLWRSRLGWFAACMAWSVGVLAVGELLLANGWRHLVQWNLLVPWDTRVVLSAIVGGLAAIAPARLAMWLADVAPAAAPVREM